MIWLQSSDVYDKIAEYDPVEGSYRELSKKLVDKSGSLKTDGMYSLLSGTFVAFYKQCDELYIQVDRCKLKLEDDVIVDLCNLSDKKKLSVLKGNEEVCSIMYGLDEGYMIDNDPTPFVDEEDFDFGLLLSKISTDKNRKNVLLGIE